MTVQEHNIEAEKYLKKLKDFFFFERGQHTSIDPRIEPRGQFSVIKINFHNKKEKERMLPRLSLFGFPKDLNGSDTIVTMDDFTNMHPILADREPGLMPSVSFLENGQLQELYQKTLSWSTQKNFRNRICCGKNFLRFQIVSFSKKALQFLKTEFPNLDFHRVGEDIFPVTKGKVTIQPVAISSNEPEKLFDLIQRVIINVFKYTVGNSIEHENTFIIGFDSEDIAVKVKQCCDLYLFAKSDDICVLKGQTLVFPSTAEYNSFEEIEAVYDPKDIPELPATPPHVRIIELSHLLLKKINELKRPIDSPQAEKKDINLAVKLIADIAEYLGIEGGYQLGQVSLNYPNGRTFSWKGEDFKPDDLLAQFLSAGYKVERKRVSFLFHSVFPIGVSTQVQQMIHEKTKTTKTGKSFSFKTEVHISEEDVTSFVNQLPDETLLTELKNRSKLPVPLQELSDNVLLDEMKRRGGDFIRKFTELLTLR